MGHGRWLSWSGFAALAVLAAFLRFQQIDIQWVTDDEWHAIHKVLSGTDYGEIALAVGGADFSIPQTLAYKWLAEHGGINEIGMRLPMLVAGLALVIAGGAWGWRHFGVAAGLGFMSLLAISPLLTYHSRVARPYAITVLLAWGALLALARWRREGRSGQGKATRWIWIYAATAVMACWLHMAVAPFVLIPLAALVGVDTWAAWRGRSLAPLRASILPGLGVATAVALLAGLPMWLHRDAMASRMGQDLPMLDTYAGVWFSWLGGDAPWLALACLPLAVLGGIEWWRCRADVLGLALVGIAATLALIYLGRPALVHAPMVFARYLLPAVPLLLLCITLGALRVLRSAGKGVVAGFALLPAVMLAHGPGMEMLVRPNNFTLHWWHQLDYRVAHNPVRAVFSTLPVSPFWQRLAALPPGSVHLAVAGRALPSFTQTDARWQGMHRQLLWNAQITAYCAAAPVLGEAMPDSGFRLENAVSLADLDSLRRARIDYVVFNLGPREGDVKEILVRFFGRALSVDENHAVAVAMSAIPPQPCIERFAREHGAAAYEDEDVVVFQMPGTGEK
ncbi:MAG: hypothetical protein LBB76_02365 [Azoarcus sp.]|jgi:hypothetical protein|nr:hypothetical protein [Azoarcus sp.]